MGGLSMGGLVCALHGRRIRLAVAPLYGGGARYKPDRFLQAHGAVDQLYNFPQAMALHARAIAAQLEYFGEHNTSNHLANNGRGSTGLVWKSMTTRLCLWDARFYWPRLRGF